MQTTSSRICTWVTDSISFKDKHYGKCLWKEMVLVWFGLVLLHIHHCRLFNAKSSLYIYNKYIRFSLVVFYGISTIVDYFISNPLYTYILNIYLVWFGLVWFYISTIVGCFIPNPLWFCWGFMAYPPLLIILYRILFIHIDIKYIRFGLVWFGLVLWHINHCRLFYTKSSLVLLGFMAYPPLLIILYRILFIHIY